MRVRYPSIVARAESATVRILLAAAADARNSDRTGKRPIDYARDNERLQGTTTYWRLLDASFN